VEQEKMTPDDPAAADASKPDDSTAVTQIPLARSFAEMIGQKDLVSRLTKLVEIARKREEVLGHILLLGPDGCGKRTVSHIIARELGVNLRATEEIKWAGDLAAIVNDLDEGDVLFVENINRLRKDLLAVLLPALKDFELNIIVGKGRGARSMKLAVKPFTLVGTAEKQSDCPRDLLNAFHAVLSFQPYNEAEIVEFAARLAAQAGVTLEPPTKALVARLSGGNLGRAKMMMDRLRLVEKQPVSEHDAHEMLSLFGFDGGSRAQTLEGIPTEWAQLSGIDFEKLIASLLSKMGFVAEMTKASGDGGVDIEATLYKPIIGGRYLFQCKRFAADNLIGSPTVREFYGALVADRKAVKGILITTSGFTPAAREFAANLHIELIVGNGLAQLVREHGGPGD
jgi:Holliday junction resolvasome RuvABC ATP-dependent DNA helicase subunit